MEITSGNFDRAVKHWIIAATQGCEDSMQSLMEAFEGGLMEKDVLAAALRAQKDAVDCRCNEESTEGKGIRGNKII